MDTKTTPILENEDLSQTDMRDLTREIDAMLKRIGGDVMLTRRQGMWMVTNLRGDWKFWDEDLCELAREVRVWAERVEAEEAADAAAEAAA